MSLALRSAACDLRPGTEDQELLVEEKKLPEADVVVDDKVATVFEELE